MIEGGTRGGCVGFSVPGLKIERIEESASCKVADVGRVATAGS